MLPGGKGCNVHVGLLEEEVSHFGNDPLWQKFFSLLETSPVEPTTADAGEKRINTKTRSTGQEP
jgi:hypothetical protein